MPKLWADQVLEKNEKKNTTQQKTPKQMPQDPYDPNSGGDNYEKESLLNKAKQLAGSKPKQKESPSSRFGVPEQKEKPKNRFTKEYGEEDYNALKGQLMEASEDPRYKALWENVDNKDFWSDEDKEFFEQQNSYVSELSKEARTAKGDVGTKQELAKTGEGRQLTDVIDYKDGNATFKDFTKDLENYDTELKGLESRKEGYEAMLNGIAGPLTDDERKRIQDDYDLTQNRIDELETERDDIQGKKDYQDALIKNYQYENLKQNGSEDDFLQYADYVGSYTNSTLDDIFLNVEASQFRKVAGIMTFAENVKQNYGEAKAKEITDTAEKLFKDEKITEEELNEFYGYARQIMDKNTTSPDESVGLALNDIANQLTQMQLNGEDATKKLVVNVTGNVIDNMVLQYGAGMMLGRAGMRLGTGVMSFAGYAPAYQKDIEAGFTHEQAMADAVYQSGIEFLTELIGGERMLRLAQGEIAPRTMAGLLWEGTKSGASEDVEESLGWALSPLAHALATGEMPSIESYDVSELREAVSTAFLAGFIQTGVSADYSQFGTPEPVSASEKLVRGFFNITTQEGKNRAQDFLTELDSMKGEVSKRRDMVYNGKMISERDYVGIVESLVKDQIAKYDQLSQVKGVEIIDVNRVNPLQGMVEDSRYALKEDMEVARLQQINSLLESYNAGETIQTINQKLAEDIESKMIAENSERLAKIQEQLDKDGVYARAQDWEKMSDEGKMNATVVSKVSDIIKGTPVEFADLRTKDGKIVDGFYNDGKIVINPEAKLGAISTLIHEYTHGLEASEYYDIMKAEVEALYGKSYKTVVNNIIKDYSNIKELSFEDAEKELVAKTFQNALGSKDFIQRLVKYNTNMAYKMYTDLKSISTISTVAEEMAQNFMQALGDAGVEVPKDKAYSFALTKNGELIVISDNPVVTSRSALTAKGKRLVENVLRNIIPKAYTIKSDGQLVNINASYADEYTYSDDAKKNAKEKPSIAKAKNKIVTNIGEVIEIAENGRWRKNEDNKVHRNDSSIGANGFYYYNTRFAIPIYNGARSEILDYATYKATLLLEHNKNGKVNFYDLVNIKKSNYSIDEESIRASFEELPATVATPSFSYVSENVKESNPFDSLGRKLSPQQRKYFADSKVVDEDGNLKEVYHSSPSAQFYIFDKSKASPTGNMGAGFYFTDAEYDANSNYHEGGPDIESRIMMYADSLWDAGETDTWEEAKEKAREYFVQGEGTDFNVYLNIKNPVYVGDNETVLMDPDTMGLEEYAKDFGYLEDGVEEYSDEYYDALDNALSSYIGDVLNDVTEIDDERTYNAVSQVLAQAYYDGGISLENLKEALVNTGELYSEYEYEIARQIVEAMGYDGIIDSSVSEKFRGMDIPYGTTHYIAFNENQIKNVDNLNPTENVDIRYSFSEKSGKMNEEASNELKRLQEPSSNLSERENELLRERDPGFLSKIREDISSLFRRGLQGELNGDNDRQRIVKVDGDSFYEFFKANRNYLKNPDTVSLHDKADYQNGTAYMSNDGLSGFYITENGDLQSVYNNSGKPGFLREISNIVKRDAKTLDCFQNLQQKLADLYEDAFGFKVASILEYNRDILIEDFGEEYADAFEKKYGKAPVYFMVNTDTDVETKHFTKDQYEEAQAYRDSFINKDNVVAQKDTGGPNGPTRVEGEVVDSYGRKKKQQFRESNLEKSAVLDEAQKEKTREMSAQGFFTYNSVINKVEVQRAREYMERDGVDKTYENFMADNYPSYKSAVQGEVLLQELAKNNDPRWEDVAIKLADDSTVLAQGLQAYAILQRMSPQGQLVAIQRNLKRMQNDLNERMGKKAPQLELNPKLVEELTKAKTNEEALDAREKIIEDLNKQLPVTWTDMINSWRYLMMLGNPRTHIRNMFGNLMFMPAIGLKNAIGTALESVANTKAVQSALKKTMGQTMEYKTKALVSRFTPEGRTLYKAGQEAYEEHKRAVEENKKYAERKGFREKTPVGKFFNKWDQLNSWALDKEDFVFAKDRYALTYAQVLKANGWDPNNLTPEQSIRANAVALNESLKATYRDASELAKWLNELERNPKLKIPGFFKKAILPFTNTPFNVVKRGARYSPLGLIDAIARGGYNVVNGNIDVNEWIDQMASGMSGFAIFELGKLLASMGILRTKDRDKDRKNAFDKDNGEQDYSIDLEALGKAVGVKNPIKGTYTLDWMTPVIMALAMGAEWRDIQMDLEQADGPQDPDEALSSAMNVMANLADPVVETSMLSSLKDAMKSYSSEGGAYFGDVVTSAIASYIGQFFPTLGGQLARTFDDTRRATSPNKGLIDKTLIQIRNKIPGLSKKNQPYINKQGQEEKNEDLGKGWVGRAFLNMFSPGYYSSKDIDKYDEELYRLYDATGEVDAFPSSASKSITYEGNKMNFSKEEYTEWHKTRWQYETKYVDQFIDSDVYKKLDDAERVKTIADIRGYAQKVAKKQFLESKGYIYTDDKELAKTDPKYIYDKEMTNVNTALDKDIDLYAYFDYVNNAGTKQAEKIKYLEGSGMTQEQKEALYGLSGYKTSYEDAYKKVFGKTDNKSSSKKKSSGSSKKTSKKKSSEHEHEKKTTTSSTKVKVGASTSSKKLNLAPPATKKNNFVKAYANTFSQSKPATGGRQQITCPKCGNKVPAGTSRCPVCGTKL